MGQRMPKSINTHAVGSDHIRPRDHDSPVFQSRFHLLLCSTRIS
jgi:hypothetical protein